MRRKITHRKHYSNKSINKGWRHSIMTSRNIIQNTLLVALCAAVLGQSIPAYGMFSGVNFSLFGSRTNPEEARQVADANSQALENAMKNVIDHVVQKIGQGTNPQAMNEFARNFAQSFGPFANELRNQFADGQQGNKDLRDTMGGITGAIAGGQLDGTFQGFGKTFEPGSVGDIGLGNIMDGLDRNIMDGFVWKNAGKGIGFGILAIVGMSGAYFGLKYGGEAFKAWFIKKYIEQPKLLSYSSIQTTWEKIKNIFRTPSHEVTTLVFEEELKKELSTLVKSIQNIHKRKKAGRTKARYPNTLLVGPAGTGKTEVAKFVAKQSGMNIFFTSGSLLTQPNVVGLLDDLFDFMEKYGGVLFIDELEVLFRSRKGMDPSSAEYKSLTECLSRLGKLSDKFMVIGATNYPYGLDDAVLTRFPNKITIGLPGLNERERILAKYAENDLFDKSCNGKQFVERAQQVLTSKKIHEIAVLTEGLSSRALANLINAINVAAAGSDDGLVTEALVTHVTTKTIAVEKEFKERQDATIKSNAAAAA